MADFSVFDNNSQMFLEITLVTWLENQNQFNLSIRPKGQRGSIAKPMAQAIVPLYLMNDLIANLSNPNTSGVISTNDNLYGSGSVGRFNNEFTITNNSGSARVTFNDVQWKILIDYFINMSSKAQEIKAIGRNVRMHVINLLRELGIDQPIMDKYFKTTTTYDYRYDSPSRVSELNRNNGNGNSNYSQKKNPNSIDGASYRNTSTGMSGGNDVRVNPATHPANINPAPLDINNPIANNFTQLNTQPIGNPVPGLSTNPGSNIPLGNPMPPLPPMGNLGSAQIPNGNMGAYTSSIQDMLNSTFNQQ